MGYRPMQRTSTRPPTLCRSPVGGAMAGGCFEPHAYNSSAGERAFDDPHSASGSAIGGPAAPGAVLLLVFFDVVASVF